MAQPQIRPPSPPFHGYHHVLTRPQIRITLSAALLTFALHVEARYAALLGHGWYTIGPCGEETLASAALALQPTDAVAWHYRHAALNLARQLQSQHSPEQASEQEDEDNKQVLWQLMLDRARAYCVSRHDPVTGGVHCSIGPSSTSSSNCDFVVTSTLASQCPAAVGRALGYALLPPPNQHHNSRPVSFVTLGDGSVHNHHFWSALHLARHARHRHIKCPVVLGIADNGLSISYATRGYVSTLFQQQQQQQKQQDPLLPVFCANGNDIMHVYDQTLQAVDYARRHAAPAIVLYQNLVRRFGHAATDRQSAYLSPTQIQNMAETTVLEQAIVQAVEVYHATTYDQVQDHWQFIQQRLPEAFAIASAEDKVTRADMQQRVAPPLVPVPPLPESLTRVSLVPGVASSLPRTTTTTTTTTTNTTTKVEKPQVMRKHMTRVLAELMQQDDTIVYLGEDVQHGGYYVVTEGLATQFPGRVIDFPPDETSLIGAASTYKGVIVQWSLGSNDDMDKNLRSLARSLARSLTYTHSLTSSSSSSSSAASAAAGGDGDGETPFVYHIQWVFPKLVCFRFVKFPMPNTSIAVPMPFTKWL